MSDPSGQLYGIEPWKPPSRDIVVSKVGLAAMDYVRGHPGCTSGEVYSALLKLEKNGRRLLGTMLSLQGRGWLRSERTWDGRRLWFAPAQPVDSDGKVK
jgi:hypothetical protein